MPLSDATLQALTQALDEELRRRVGENQWTPTGSVSIVRDPVRNQLMVRLSATNYRTAVTTIDHRELQASDEPMAIFDRVLMQIVGAFPNLGEDENRFQGSYARDMAMPGPYMVATGMISSQLYAQPSTLGTARLPQLGVSNLKSVGKAIAKELAPEPPVKSKLERLLEDEELV